MIAWWWIPLSWLLLLMAICTIIMIVVMVVGMRKKWIERKAMQAYVDSQKN